MGIGGGLVRINYNEDSGMYTDFYGRPVFTSGPLSKGYIQKNNPALTPSPINNLLAKAAAAQVNVPTLQSLFPSMGMQGILGTPMQSPMANQTPMYNQFSFTSPSYGAGRFLGGNAMTSNAMNTTTGNTTT